jgi:S-adenosylmethionine hydrolase
VRLPHRLRPKQVALVTDFGAGPYVGQIRLLLAAASPRLPVVDLIADLPPFRPDLAAYLLPALLRRMPPRTLYLCVVDPGVGSDRGVLAASAAGSLFVAPDNGLLVPLVRQCRKDLGVWRVHWRPTDLSASFHGRDLFTPLAVRMAAGAIPLAEPLPPQAMAAAALPASSPRICYIDHYGNAMSGLWAADVARSSVIVLNAHRIGHARTFSDVPIGQPFWYENAFGLLEIAVNQGRADQALGLAVGDAIAFAR